MSIQDNIQKLSNFTGMMIKVTPRVWLKPSMFVSHSGFIYKIENWSMPVPRKITFNSIILTEQSSSSLSGNDWFYDRDSLTLYVRMNSGANLSTTLLYLMCEVEVYHSTFENMWTRDPSDEDSEQIFWNGDIVTSPEVSIYTQSSKYGFVVADSSGFDIANKQKIVNQILHSGSYKNAEVKIWHVIGDKREESSYNLIFTGVIDGRVDVGFETIRFQISNRAALLNGNIPFVQIDDVSENNDPAFNGAILTFLINKCVRAATGIKAVNTQSTEIDGTASTSNNRTHAVFYAANSVGDIYDFQTSVSYLSVNSGGFNLVFANLSDREYFKAGDLVVVETSGSGTFYTSVQSISGSGVFLDDTIPSSSGSVKRCSVGRVFIFQNDIRYELKQFRDFTTAINSGKLEIVLTSSCESNVGASTLDPKNGDFVFVVAEAWPKKQTYQGNPFSTSYATGSRPYRDIYELIYFYLKQVCEVSEDEINVEKLQSLRDEFGDLIENDDFIFPCVDKFSAVLDKVSVFNQLLQRAECVAFFGEDGRVTVEKMSERSTPIEIVDLDEIDNRLWNYSIDYSDVKSKELSGQTGIIALQASKADELAGTNPADSVVIDVSYVRNFEQDPKVLYLHKEKTYTTENIYYSDRRGLLSVKVPFKLSNKNIGQTITVKSAMLLGHEYEQNTKHERDFIIRDISWSDNGTSVILEDLFDAETGS